MTAASSPTGEGEQEASPGSGLRWSVEPDPGVLTATITFASRTPVFAPGSLRLDCVSQIVR